MLLNFKNIDSLRCWESLVSYTELRLPRDMPGK